MRSSLRTARALALPALALALGACSIPFTKSKDERKAECDRISASAIQAGSPREAKELAAQASACYARIE